MSVLGLDDVKPYLNIETTDEDAQIQLFIDAAETAIAEKVGPLAATAVTERIWFPSGRAIVLAVTPVISITSITSSTGATVTPAAAWVDGDSGVILSDSTSFVDDWYDVVYQAGHNPCPADLLTAARELVRHLWKTQGGPVGSRQGIEDLPGSAFAFPIRVEQLLAAHTGMGFA